MYTPPVLNLQDFSQTFVVEFDAYGIGIGVTLSQEGRPISFYGEALKGFALLLSTYKKEMLEIVKVVKKWRPYLLVKPFVVKTDKKV